MNTVRTADPTWLIVGGLLLAFASGKLLRLLAGLLGWLWRKLKQFGACLGGAAQGLLKRTGELIEKIRAKFRPKPGPPPKPTGAFPNHGGEFVDDTPNFGTGKSPKTSPPPPPPPPPRPKPDEPPPKANAPKKPPSVTRESLPDEAKDTLDTFRGGNPIKGKPRRPKPFRNRGKNKLDGEGPFKEHDVLEPNGAIGNKRIIHDEGTNTFYYTDNIHDGNPTGHDAIFYLIENPM